MNAEVKVWGLYQATPLLVFQWLLVYEEVEQPIHTWLFILSGWPGTMHIPDNSFLNTKLL